MHEADQRCFTWAPFSLEEEETSHSIKSLTRAPNSSFYLLYMIIHKLELIVKVGIKFPVLVGQSFPVSDHYSNPTEPTRRRSFMRKESALRLTTWAWCKSRSSMAVATASSDMSSAHLENGLFEVRTIEPVS